MQSILLKKNKIRSQPEFFELLRKTPVILSVRSAEELEQCLSGSCGIIFVLFGDILTIPDIIARIKDAGKLAMVHIDLIDGLASRDVGVDFLDRTAKVDGIVSTKANLIKRAKSLGLLTIQRFFVLDSLSLINIDRQFPLEYTDAIEILPGIIPKVIRRMAGITDKPIIVGGLISDRDDVRHALEAGAISVSTSNMALFFP
jgi:glycerol uptake operon antiterminator